MADPNTPPTDDPFHDLVSQGNGETDPADPFAKMVQEQGGVAAPKGSFGGSVGRGAMRSAAPALGGLAAAGPGAEIGATLGATLGLAFPPAEPFLVGGGAIAGGLAGMFGGGAAVSAAQDWALRQLPDSWTDKLGMSDRQQRLDEAQHPVGSFIGGTIPYALAMRPSNIFKGAPLPENATAMQRLMANPVTKALFGGGAMGGLELGQEAIHGDIDWRKVAISTGFGVVFNKPTRLGQGITEMGAAPVRAGLEEMRTRIGNYAGPSLTGPQDFRIPTVAEVGDTKVMGPGITEEVFQGTNQQDPAAEATAQQTARDEKRVLGGGQGQQQDVNAVARRMEPEAFAQYDSLLAQRNELSQWVAEQSNPTDAMLQPLVDRRDALQAQLDKFLTERGGYTGGPEARRLRAQIRDVERESAGLSERRQAYLEGRAQDTPEIAQARQRLMQVDEQLRDAAGLVRPALRRASEAIGNGMVPAPVVDEAGKVVPEQGATVAPATEQSPSMGSMESMDAQKASIAADVMRQVMAAGRPEAEARAAGSIWGNYYATRASRFGGKLGTPLELYRREGAQIRGPGGRVAPPPAPAAPAALATSAAAGVAPEPVAAAAAAPAPTAAAAPPLPKGFEDWTPGSQVNAGPVKGLTVVGYEDGKFTLAGRNNSQFEFTPPAKRPKDENSTDWLIGLERLPDRPQGGVEAASTPVPQAGVQTAPEAAPSPAAPVAPVQEAAAAKAPVRGAGPAHGFDLVVQEEKARLLKADKAARKEARRAGEKEPERRQPGERDYLARTAAFEKDAGTHLDDLKEEYKLTPDQVNDLSKVYNRQPGEHRDVALARAWETYSQWEERIGIAEAGERVDQIPADAASPYPTTVGANVFGSEHLVNPTLPGALPEGFYSPPPSGVPIERTFEQRREEFKTEPGQEGLPQTLIPGVEPIKGSFQEELARLRAERAPAQEAVRAAMEAKNTKLVLENADGRKLVLTRGTEDAPYRVTSFDKDGPVGHRDYSAADDGGIFGVGGIVQEVQGALRNGYKITEGGVQPKGLKGGNAPPPAGGLFDTEGRKQGELFQGALGRIRIREGMPSIITLAKNADASTFIHETGHDFFEQLMRDAEHPDAPGQLKDDAQALYDKLKVNGREEVKDRHHEQVAKWFEQYLREGRAPSEGLAGVFQQFKSWLMDIYQSLKGLGTPISDDIRTVFDRMLAEEPQATVVAEGEARGPTLADVLTGDAKMTEPFEAEAVADRAAAEIERAVTEPPPRVANEIQAAVVKVEAEQKAAADARGENGAGTEQPGEVGTGGEPTTTEPGGGGVGEGGGQELRGGSEPAAEGEGLSGSEQRRGAGANAEPPLAARPAVSYSAAAESPLVDKAGNIRVENITSVQELADAIHDAADRNGDFAAAQGPMTSGQVLDLADTLGLRADQVDQAQLARIYGGFDQLASKALAIRQLLNDSAGLVVQAAKRATESNTAEDIAKWIEATDRHDLIQGTVAKVTAEMGRGLGQGFRNLEQVRGATTPAELNEAMKASTGRTLFQMRQIAKLASRLDNAAAVSKFSRDGNRNSFGRMLLEYWINALISGPATHTTYMVGNTILAAEKMGPETAVAAGIGAIRQALGREGDTVRIGEIGAAMRGVQRGMAPAMKAAIDSLRTGVTTMLPGEERRMMMPLQPGSEMVTPAMMDEGARMTDVAATGFGLIRGVRDALVSTSELLAAGGIEGSPLIGTEYTGAGAIPNITVRGAPVLPVGAVLRAPSRMVAVIHSFQRSLNYSVEKAMQAYRTAANEGLSGAQFDQRVSDIWQNPMPGMMESIRHEATEMTLMGQGSKFTQTLSRLMNTEVNLPVLGPTQLLKFIDPFVHISSNIIDQALIKRTPLGTLLSPELRADLMGRNGTIAQDKAQARMLVGTAFATAIGGLTAQGFASGSGPSDPRESAMWRLAGNQAHSVRIGDFWYDTHRLGPIGMLMSMGADMYDVAHMANQGEFGKAAAHLQHAITQNILDESFVRGPADLIKAMEDPGRYGDSYIRNFLSSFVPFSVGLAQEARAMDPYSREARTVIDAMRAKIPGESMNLLPKRDIWGNEMPNRTALVGSTISAIYMQHVGQDPVNQELLKLGIYPAPVDRKIRGVELTPQQHDDFARLAGRMAKSGLDRIINSPQWQTFPPESRAHVIREQIKQTREAARGMIIAKDPSIIQKAQALKMNKLHPPQAEKSEFESPTTMDLH